MENTEDIKGELTLRKAYFLANSLFNGLSEERELFKHLGVVASAVLGFFAAFNGERIAGGLTIWGTMGIIGLGIVIIFSMISIKYSLGIFKKSILEEMKRESRGVVKTEKLKEEVSLAQKYHSKYAFEVLLGLFILSIMGIIVDIFLSTSVI